MPSQALVLESLKEKDSETLASRVSLWSSRVRSEFGSKQEVTAQEDAKQLAAVYIKVTINNPQGMEVAE